MNEPAVSVGALGLGGVAGGAAPVGAFGLATAAGSAALSVEGADAIATDGPSGLTSLTGSPKWSHVVKKGRRQVRENNDAEASFRLHTGQPGRRKKTGNAKPIIETGTVGNIRVVKTKLVSVFASKFSPDLDAETLSGYLKEKL